LATRERQNWEENEFKFKAKALAHNSARNLAQEILAVTADNHVPQGPLLYSLSQRTPQRHDQLFMPFLSLGWAAPVKDGRISVK